MQMLSKYSFLGWHKIGWHISFANPNHYVICAWKIMIKMSTLGQVEQNQKILETPIQEMLIRPLSLVAYQSHSQLWTEDFDIQYFGKELLKDASRVVPTVKPQLNRSISSPAAAHSDRRTTPASRTSRPDFRNVPEC